MNKHSLSLRDFNRLFPSEETARAWFEGVRRPDGPVCRWCVAVAVPSSRPTGSSPSRWNRKAVTCLERMVPLVRNDDGRKLPYGFLTGAV